jgi:Tfp pilus assembly protein PilN
MIKINLLESVTDRPQGVAAVEEKVSSPRIQTLLLALTVFGLMVLAMGYDYVSSNMANAAATKELENQKRINAQMLAIQKEQMELEKKTKEIQARIDAIKKLRESQQGPTALLQEIKARFDAVPGLYLTSIDNKDGEVTIKGISPNEYAVTKFGQSLEFSNGLFSNLNIETTREAAKQAVAANAPAAPATPASPAASDGSIAIPEVIAFTVKANFGSSKSQSQQSASAPAPAAATATQVAMKK